MIREYNESDINLINVLGRDLHSDYLFEKKEFRNCYVYEEGDLLGFITYDLFEDRAEVIDIIVHINHRHRGIGTKLLSKVIEVCSNGTCKSITLEVRDTNDFAVELYKKHGFKIVSKRKRYYDFGNVDAYVMLRDL